MKLTLRVFAFCLCLVATYSAASFNKLTPSVSAPMPTCNPADPHCTLIP